MRPRLTGEPATKISDVDRAFIIQCYHAGLKYREIAAATDRTIGTICCLIVRLRWKGVIGRDRY